MTTKKTESKVEEVKADIEQQDAKKADAAKQPTLSVKPDGEGAVTDASESSVKTVAPLAAEDKTNADVDSVAVVAKTNVTEVQDLQNVTDIPDHIIEKFATLEDGKFKTLHNAGQQGSADKYLHELAEDFVDNLAKNEKILVKADMVVKNYIRSLG